MARQFNLIPPICEQAEYHMFQREKVEVQLPELFHKIGTVAGVLSQAPPKARCSPKPGAAAARQGMARVPRAAQPLCRNGGAAASPPLALLCPQASEP